MELLLLCGLRKTATFNVLTLMEYFIGPSLHGAMFAPYCCITTNDGPIKYSMIRTQRDKNPQFRVLTLIF